MANKYGISTTKQLCDEFNALTDKSKKDTPHAKVEETLEGYTDRELYIFIAGNTLRMTHDFIYSLTNAKCHLEDKQRAIGAFSV